MLEHTGAHKTTVKSAGELYLQLHVWQYVMRQLQIAQAQGNDGLQLSTQGGSVQVEHGRVLIPLLVLLTEATGFVVPHHAQVDLCRRKEIQYMLDVWNC